MHQEDGADRHENLSLKLFSVLGEKAEHACRQCCITSNICMKLGIYAKRNE